MASDAIRIVVDTNIIVSAAGNLDHDGFVELVTRHFEHMMPMNNGFHSSAPKIVSRITLRNKKALEQVQLCIGVPAHPIAHQKRHAGYILNTLLGGGMSSRLFQNIRERQGLAYSIYSDLNPYRDTGSNARMITWFMSSRRRNSLRPSSSRSLMPCSV